MPGFPSPQIDPPRDPDRLPEWLRQLATILGNVMQGKLNATATVTLTANAASTTVTDFRVGAGSCITFMPMTPNAAAEIGAGTMYVSARGKREFTITHANNGQVDRDFVYQVIG